MFSYAYLLVNYKFMAIMVPDEFDKLACMPLAL